jgi:arylsulfatase A-like enzyme
MNRRQFLASAAAAPLAAGQSGQPRPNIVLIVADDLGYGDLGCYGQQRIQTPNIDRLAREGTRFTDAYAGSTVCAPSRCSLFTGLHMGHARVRGNGPVTLRKEDVTLTEVLKQAGYRTGIVGKWSLGGIGQEGYPLDKGFDEWLGYFSQSQAHLYYPEMLLDGRRERNLQQNWGTRRGVYAHDLFTERAVEFIRKEGAPFFLHVSWTIPHANNELGRETGNGMEVPSDEPYTRESWPQVEKNFAAMITRMDRDVGRLLAALKEKGIDDHTLVLFTSDNGPHREGGHAPEFFRSSGPLRGIKRDLYEGGIRVPMIARWPGQAPAGRTSGFPWAFWDVLPTLAELAGARVGPGLDGISVVPTLLGREQKPHDYLYWEFYEGGFRQAVRQGDWKAVRALNAPLELYNLRDDLAETRNLAGQNAGAVRRMEEIMRAAHADSPDFPVNPPRRQQKKG